MGNKGSKSTAFPRGSTTSLNQTTVQNGGFKRTMSLPTQLNKSKSSRSLYDFDNSSKYLSLKTETFKGSKEDSQFKDIQEDIVKVSKELQEFRRKLKSETDKLTADRIQKNLSDCMSALVRKAQENPGSEVGSVILRNPKHATLEKPSQRQSKRQTNRTSKAPPGVKYQKRTQPLEDIRNKVIDIKSDTDTAILQQNTNRFDKLENRIKTICRDLELVEAEEHTPLYEKKEELYTALINCNRSIRRAKKKIKRQIAVDIPEPDKALQELETLEKQVQRINLLRMAEPESTQEAKEKYEMVLAKLVSLKDTTDIKERKKTALDEVRNKLDEINLEELENNLRELRKEVVVFNDIHNSPSYTSLDQRLRQLWDKTSILQTTTYKKDVLIQQIQDAIQLLKQTAQTVEKSKEATIYQNKEVVHQNLNRSISQEHITKAPLPTPRETDLQSYITEMESQIDNTDPIMRSKLDYVKTNLSEIMQEISRTASKSSCVESERRESLDDTAYGTTQSSGPASELNLTEMADSIHEEAPKDLIQDAKDENVPPHSGSYSELTKSKNVGKYLDSNTVYYDFTGKKQKPDASPDNAQILAEEITRIQKVSKNMQIEIANFTSVTKDSTYESIQTNLNNCLSHLMEVHSGSSKELVKSKSDLIQQILQLLEDLDNKVVKNQERYREVKNELKEVVDKLHSLKKKVDSFSGAYKNVLFIQIETELLRCLDRLSSLDFPGDSKLEYAIAQAKQKNEHYIKILEEKSVKSHQQVDETPKKPATVLTPTQCIHNVRQKLVKIKDDAELFAGTNEDPIYIAIHEELDQCSSELSGIEDLGRTAVQSAKNQYLDYVQELKKYVDQKAEQVRYMNSRKSELPDDGNKMVEIEKDLEVIMMRVDAFSGSTNDPQYAHLDEQLIKIQIELDRLKTNDNEKLLLKKRNLMKNVQMYLKILNDKAQKQSKISNHEENTEQILKALDSLEVEVNKLDETIDEKTYDVYNDYLVELFIKTENAKAEERKKQQCKENIFRILRTLKKKVHYVEKDRHSIKFFADMDGVQI